MKFGNSLLYNNISHHPSLLLCIEWEIEEAKLFLWILTWQWDEYFLRNKKMLSVEFYECFFSEVKVMRQLLSPFSLLFAHSFLFYWSILFVCHSNDILYLTCFRSVFFLNTRTKIMYCGCLSNVSCAREFKIKRNMTYSFVNKLS